MSGVAIDGVVIQPVFVLDLVDHLVAADEIGAGFLWLRAACRLPAMTRTFLDLAESVGQHDRAAHHLVGVFGIDAQTHMQFHGLVKLGKLNFLNEFHGFVKRVRTSLNLRSRSGKLLTCLLTHLVILTGTNGSGGKSPSPPKVARNDCATSRVDEP